MTLLLKLRLVMRELFFFIIAIFAVIQLPAQESFKRNALYVEMLGNGLVLSANYERQMSTKPGLGLHLGVGLGNAKPVFPFGAKYLIDVAGQRSFFELGAGVTLADEGQWHLNAKSESYSAGFIPSVGYRYNAPKGFMWRINYTPVFNKYRTELLFFGLSIGWRI
jgi:hypothetical protein